MKFTALITLVVVATGLATPSIAQSQKAANVTLIIEGAHCDDCTRAVKTALSQQAGITFNPAEIQSGVKPRYFTEPFVIKIADASQTRIGDLARTVGETKTPHRDEFPPNLCLTLFTPDLVNVGEFETAISTFRSELRFVNGVVADQPGALGGFPDRGFLWLQLDKAGGAEVEDILTAAKRAELKVSVEKP